MANKFEVLVLIDQGFTNNEIAERLGCLPAYVRAVKAREFGNGKDVGRRYYEKSLKTAEGREAKRVSQQKWYWGHVEEARRSRREHMRRTRAANR